MVLEVLAELAARAWGGARRRKLLIVLVIGALAGIAVAVVAPKVS